MGSGGARRRRCGALSASLLALVLAAGLGACSGGSTSASPSASPAATAGSAAPTDDTDAIEPGDPSSSATGSVGTPLVTVDPSQTAAATSKKDLSDLAELAQKVAGKENRRPTVGGGTLGADVSWPQCPAGMGIAQKRSSGSPMPIAAARYVIIGLTNGPGFTPNPCLASQVAWVRQRGLLAGAYSVVSYPGSATLGRYGDQGPFDAGSDIGRLANVGYQQARYNVANMRAAGLRAPGVWVDVEPVPDFDWSSSAAANAAVVQGAVRGYQEAGLVVGIYSTPALWGGVVGDLALGVPEWRAAGQTSRSEAVSRCGSDWQIQGGDAVMGQWVESSRDMNTVCPGADLGPWLVKP